MWAAHPRQQVFKAFIFADVQEKTARQKSKIQTTQSDNVFSLGLSEVLPCFLKLLYRVTLSSQQLKLPSNQYCKVKATPSFALDSSIYHLLPATFALEGKQKRTGKNYLSAI